MTTNPKIALFVDAENGCNAGDLLRLMSELETLGDVVLKKAIGDWSRQKFNKKLDWLGIGFKIVDQSRQVAGRNSSDFRLVIEAMELALNPDNDIDTFAVMSSDQGFIPLYLRLRQLGKKVIVAGNGSLENHRIRGCTDRIIATGTRHLNPSANLTNAKQNATPSPNKRHAQNESIPKVAKTPMNKMQRDRTRNLIRRSLGKLRSAKTPFYSPQHVPHDEAPRPEIQRPKSRLLQNDRPLE